MVTRERRLRVIVVLGVMVSLRELNVSCVLYVCVCDMGGDVRFVGAGGSQRVQHGRKIRAWALYEKRMCDYAALGWARLPY